jgi:TorA maturation chaperone TorD
VNAEQTAFLTFAGSAFLSPEPARLLALARELGDAEFVEILETQADGLEQDYNRLFLNPLGTPLPPWQDANQEEARLMGEAHLSALEWYRRFGVAPQRTSDPADHIGLLLLFYARLLDDAPEEAEAFRIRHIDWIPEFCSKVETQAQHPFLRTLAQRLRQVLA